MSTERWYWLWICCAVSAALQLWVVWVSPTFRSHIPDVKPTQQIEVTLEAPVLPQPPPPVTQPEPPHPLLQPEPKPEKVADQPAVPLVKPAPLAQMAASHPDPETATIVTAVPAPQPEAPTPGVVDEHRPIAPPVRPADAPRLSTVVPSPPLRAPSGIYPNREQTPIALGEPTGRVDANMYRLHRTAHSRFSPEGGSEAPGEVLSGHGGFKGPETKPEDVLFSGVGAGGINLPRAAPKTGGGGGRSILSVNNPLAAESVHDDAPGLGPGHGGGIGAGAGGGVGFAHGPGIGTSPNGKYALATLRAKPGSGIGAAHGSGIGTHSPGGGTGTGSELPGTGGQGSGYGRGSGTGTLTGNGSPTRAAHIGVPLGDLHGLLHGSPTGGGGQGGGPGGPGRGGIFGQPPVGGGGAAPVHIVYVLDTSGSMKDGNKIGKAQQALKMALAGLTPYDTFDIVTFYGAVQTFSTRMTPATPENVARGMSFVDTIAIGDRTNFSGALEAALSLRGITQVYLLSDGEPNMGIQNAMALRALVKRLNVENAHITTMALGMGEAVEGADLLKAIAADSHGTFSYVNLRR